MILLQALGPTVFHYTGRGRRAEGLWMWLVIVTDHRRQPCAKIVGSWCREI